jgi:ATP-dependent Lhr-like helicase
MPLDFQEDAWHAYAEGDSGLIQVPTGAGKTYAATLPALAEIAGMEKSALGLLYITPLRAVARDVERTLRDAAQGMGLDLRIETRTGDTPASVRRRQRIALPQVLITTPESLSLLLSYPGASGRFLSLRCVVVDEWHELLGTKRGSQTELCLARLRRLCPRVRIWGLSATLSNVEEAAAACVGVGNESRLVRSAIGRPVRLRTLLPRAGPEDGTRLSAKAIPWAGHLGLGMLPRLLEELATERSTLIFTNTRSQAERWFGALQEARPEMFDRIALHHGSIDRAEREAVERGIKDRSLRWVVATSALDLGVDFGPVEQVVQIGSIRGVGRLMQRAGRSAHRPGETCEILFVPTHALQLVEAAAARSALASDHVEPCTPLSRPLDVLAQHLMTLACGDGFDSEDIETEVRSAYGYRSLTGQELKWVLEFLERGGDTLRTYPRYHRIVRRNGQFVVREQDTAKLHRLSIGTIVSNSTVALRYGNGQPVGFVEEKFLARLRKGDAFTFGGKRLALVSLRGSRAIVRKAQGLRDAVAAVWVGTGLPTSEGLSAAVRRALGKIAGPEGPALARLWDEQNRLSSVPEGNEILLETLDIRQGAHLFLYPFESVMVHEGIGALLASRLMALRKATIEVLCNDHGLLLRGPRGYPFADLFSMDLLCVEGLDTLIGETINLGGMVERQFREIAQIAGLVFPGYPGASLSSSQIRTSAGLLYKVFAKHDPANLLLLQARREVLEGQLELQRLGRTLRRLSGLRPRVNRLQRPGPLAFPLLIESVASRFSNQSLRERIEELKKQWSGDAA